MRAQTEPTNYGEKITTMIEQQQHRLIVNINDLAHFHETGNAQCVT